jgi:RNA polymerase sigma factor (TIGR02999 family)
MANAHPLDDGEITSLLHAASGGDREAFGRLVGVVYGELARLAHARLRAEPVGHTLGTTGLVHEAYLRLASQERAAWQNREQFFAVASEAMRRILVDHARRRLREKRGGGVEHVPLDDALEAVALTDEQSEELVALDAALARLAAFNPEGARIVQLHFFGGLSQGEIATMLGSSERTVRRQWSVARAWLRRELRGGVSSLSGLG